jgi:hypothetical protein
MKMAESRPLTVFSLIAPCGMNCGICLAYLREKNKCPGCRGADPNKPKTRLHCKIKTCSTFTNGKARFCFACETFPCDRLRHLDKRYRTKYRMSMIENLEQIKKAGIKKFAAWEKIRWACSECGGIVCVHKGYCLACGNKIRSKVNQIYLKFKNSGVGSQNSEEGTTTEMEESK